jgi:hypothetical protein
MLNSPISGWIFSYLSISKCPEDMLKKAIALHKSSLSYFNPKKLVDSFLQDEKAGKFEKKTKKGYHK